MVDNGAELSVIPPSLADRRNLDPGFMLQAVNKTSISTYGQRLLSLNFGLRRNFSFVFVIADVSTALLAPISSIPSISRLTSANPASRTTQPASASRVGCLPAHPWTSASVARRLVPVLPTFLITTHSCYIHPVLLQKLGTILFCSFVNDIRHVCGPQNAVADAFLHVSINALHFPAGVDFAVMANEQAQADRPRAKDFPGFLFKDVPLPDRDGTILCKVSIGVNRLFVPEKLRRQVFDALHCISHPGARAIQKLIATRFVWPNMNKDIRAWARSCLHCQRSKVSRHNRSPIRTFRMPDARFSHLHLDLIGPLSISRGCTYLLTCVDRFSR